MSLINLQAALYFPKDRNILALRAGLQSAVQAINRQLKLNLRPLDETNAEAFTGSEEAFTTNGQQIFLVYDEEKSFYGTNEFSLQLEFIDDYKQANAIHITPELTEPTQELTNLVWERLLSIVRVLADQMKPLIAQINGLDEEDTRQLISAKTIQPGSLPEFFTPFTYLDNSLIDSSVVEKLKAGGAFKIERLSSGWAFQFVENFYAQPSAKLKSAIRSLLRKSKVAYKQTAVDED